MSRSYRIPTPFAIDREQLRDEIEAATGLTVVGGERDGIDLIVAIELVDGTDDIALQGQLEQIVASHSPDEVSQLDQLVQKARQVWSGQGSFTQAQAQKILAGLVLLENRRR